jgi:hypothetical protein
MIAEQANYFLVHGFAACFWGCIGFVLALGAVVLNRRRHAAVRRLGQPAIEPAPRAFNILDSYVKSAPSNQNAIDIFSGEWASAFPPPLDGLKAGGIPLFQDDRIAWAIERVGGVVGKNVLELGPLEAGHSYMLEKAGAASVLAIEANTRAYLKCLAVKEIFNLSRCRFLCGDFVEFLSQADQRFDLILASGVLYHMKDPLRFLELLSKHTDRLFIWTHYYDADLINAKDYLKSKFFTEEKVELANGGTATLHRHEYQTMLQSQSFCGGSEAYSKWINRHGLLAALKSFGFTDFEINHETPDHPHGPAFSVVALRK